MKRGIVISIALFILSLLFSGFSEGLDGGVPVEYDQGLVHPYSMIAYKNMILVSNLGYDVLAEDQKQGKGFVSAIQAGVVKNFIRPDGHLIAPKGMAIYSNLLFIADLGKIVVYNLKKITNPPVEIRFPLEEETLTDIEVVGDMLIVSVNNTGHIFGLDLRSVNVISAARPILLAELPGAGMMSIAGSKLYINSFSSEISDSSLIYVADLTSESNNPFVSLSSVVCPGQYLGLTTSEESGKLYYSSLKTAEINQPIIFSWNFDGSEKPRLVDCGFELKSPTSLLLVGDNLWVTDYVQSKVYRFELK